MKLYVDDIRKAPKGWDQSFNFDEALYMLSVYKYDTLSLDHDLGFEDDGTEHTGYDILNWLELRQFNGNFIPPVIFAHTANPIGLKRMNVVIDKLKNKS